MDRRSLDGMHTMVSRYSYSWQIGQIRNYCGSGAVVPVLIEHFNATEKIVGEYFRRRLCDVIMEWGVDTMISR